MLFQALGADDSWSRPVFVKSFHSPCGTGKSWNIFFQYRQLDMPFASEGVLVFIEMDWEEKLLSYAPLCPDCCAKQSVGFFRHAEKATIEHGYSRLQ